MTTLDFAKEAKRIASENNIQFLLPVIEKELLHYEILRVLDENNFLNDLVFQGGTCLRLSYGAPRYSEDLDFAGGVDFNSSDLADLKNCLQNELPEKYAVGVRVVEPRKEDSLVKKWNIRIDTSPMRPDLPSQKISLEIASVPAYTNEPRALIVNYSGISPSFADIILSTESLEEILADKLEAFVCSNHIRHRDIWDMFWIIRRPSVDVQLARELRKKKEIDYGEQDQFANGIVRATQQLSDIVNGSGFEAQMRRFLPTDLYERTVARAEWRIAAVSSIQDLYR